MKLSVITLSFNSESSIERTIKSVLKQTYENVEYIVIDGGSTDSTIEIISRYKDHISVFISERDKGIYDALNKGIKVATGNLIGILHSDDFFYNDNVLSEVMLFHSRNLIDASVSNIVQCDRIGSLKRVYNARFWSPWCLRFGFMPPHPGIFVRREVFNRIGLFNCNYRIAADYDWLLRAFEKGRISWKYLSITSTIMTIGGASSSGISSYRKISREMLAILQSNGYFAPRIIINIRFVWKIFGLFHGNLVRLKIVKY